MNQYVIVSFLQKSFPLVFHKPNWPLHITIVRPFFSDRSGEEFLSVLATTCSQNKPMITFGKSREMFGLDGDISVTELENTPVLQIFYDQIAGILKTWIEFRTPQYKTYRPHVSDQTTGIIAVGEEVAIDSVSLLELVGDERRVLGTVNF